MPIEDVVLGLGWITFICFLVAVFGLLWKRGGRR